MYFHNSHFYQTLYVSNLKYRSLDMVSLCFHKLHDCVLDIWHYHVQILKFFQLIHFYSFYHSFYNCSQDTRSASELEPKHSFINLPVFCLMSPAFYSSHTNSCHLIFISLLKSLFFSHSKDLKTCFIIILIFWNHSRTCICVCLCVPARLCLHLCLCLWLCFVYACVSVGTRYLCVHISVDARWG